MPWWRDCHLSSMLARVVSRFLVNLIVYRRDSVLQRKRREFYLRLAASYTGLKKMFNLIESSIQITQVCSKLSLCTALKCISLSFSFALTVRESSKNVNVQPEPAGPCPLEAHWDTSPALLGFTSFFGSQNYFYRQTRSADPSWKQASAMDWWDWCVWAPPTSSPSDCNNFEMHRLHWPQDSPVGLNSSHICW